jgi:hypothetical protein
VAFDGETPAPLAADDTGGTAAVLGVVPRLRCSGDVGGGLDRLHGMGAGGAGEIGRETGGRLVHSGLSLSGVSEWESPSLAV